MLLYTSMFYSELYFFATIRKKDSFHQVKNFENNYEVSIKNVYILICIKWFCPMKKIS